MSWEHLVKELVMFNLEKRRLGFGGGEKGHDCCLGSLRGVGERGIALFRGGSRVDKRPWGRSP